MKVGVVTLPLHTNYGGILQAYALKSAIESLGHEVTVFDKNDKIWFPPLWKAPFMYTKRALLRALKGSKGPEVFREFRLKREYPIVSSKLSPFITKELAPRMLDDYSQIKEGEYEAFVVGSDQVWRPSNFEPVQDAFLRFAKGWDVRRVSYAASFGTSELEYEYFLLEECSSLLDTFDAVSVREDSGVQLCDEWFDCDKAVHVLDPVMLLDVEDYRKFAENAAERKAKGKVATYILDRSKVKKNVADFVVKCTGKEVFDLSVYPKDRYLPLQDRIAPSIQEWIAGFEDADFVVTDSFHGCVMSILFHKPFLVIGNSARGLSRVLSLLNIFGLESRLVEGIDPDDDGDGWLMEMDWDNIEVILDQWRRKSFSFLSDALQAK